MSGKINFQSKNNWSKKHQRQANKTDKETLVYLTSLQVTYVKVEQMHTESGKLVAQDIINKFEGYKRWALMQIEKLK